MIPKELKTSDNSIWPNMDLRQGSKFDHHLTAKSVKKLFRG